LHSNLPTGQLGIVHKKSGRKITSAGNALSLLQLVYKDVGFIETWCLCRFSKKSKGYSI